jgi:glucose/arabinose dehydrogenase
MTKAQKIWAGVIGGVLILSGAAYAYYKTEIGVINIPKTEKIDTENPSPQNDITSRLHVPDGFQIGVYASGLTGARVIEFDPKGRLVVSQTSEGKIVLIEDTNNDGKADSVKTLAEGLLNPHGLAFKCDGNVCDLYVAESNALSKYVYDAEAGALRDKEKLTDLDFSKTNLHKTRTLLFLDDPSTQSGVSQAGTLLVSVGSSCNVCNEEGSMHARIMAYDLQTKKLTEYARGLRNSVFMARNPVTGKIFASEMGRDGLGDETPPDEMNIVESGRNYGWPVCYGKNIHDTNFDKNIYIRNPCMEPLEAAPAIEFPAHSAPLGFSFVPEEGWQDEYWHNLFLAFHGSWNRSTPTGYKVVRIKMNAKGEYLGTEDFITGWLTPEGGKLGRPVDVKALPGGTMYISDDTAGLIYRVIRTRENP